MSYSQPSYLFSKKFYDQICWALYNYHSISIEEKSSYQKTILSAVVIFKI